MTTTKRRAKLAVAADPDQGSARTKLLAAAEALIVEQGLHAVRTRELVARAGVNISLIAYYFGGVEALVLEVLRRNLDRFTARQTELASTIDAKGPASPEVIITALLAPIQVSAAFTPDARASMVLQEIITHSTEASMMAEGRLETSFRPLLARLVDACPHLSADAVIWRFCCVCGGAMSMSPRAPAWQLYRTLCGRDPVTDDAELRELIATAAGALSYPPAKALVGVSL